MTLWMNHVWMLRENRLDCLEDGKFKFAQGQEEAKIKCMQGRWGKLKQKGGLQYVSGLMGTHAAVCQWSTAAWLYSQLTASTSQLPLLQLVYSSYLTEDSLCEMNKQVLPPGPERISGRNNVFSRGINLDHGLSWEISRSVDDSSDEKMLSLWAFEENWDHYSGRWGH